MRTRLKRMESWLPHVEKRSHPRILRLYHKMAPTASSASSSNRSTGTTMEAVSETNVRDEKQVGGYFWRQMV